MQFDSYFFLRPASLLRQRMRSCASKRLFRPEIVHHRLVPASGCLFTAAPAPILTYGADAAAKSFPLICHIHLWLADDDAIIKTYSLISPDIRRSRPMTVTVAHGNAIVLGIGDARRRRTWRRTCLTVRRRLPRPSSHVRSSPSCRT
ncbi:hypothetical protein [Aestuariivirga sp.]|uniref:hypothetical protein n=1 Tax=Aestuariivirga sp. TaxID=2650926 RepID=UPI0039E62D1E